MPLAWPGLVWCTLMLRRQSYVQLNACCRCVAPIPSHARLPGTALARRPARPGGPEQRRRRWRAQASRGCVGWWRLHPAHAAGTVQHRSAFHLTPRRCVTHQRMEQQAMTCPCSVGSLASMHIQSDRQPSPRMLMAALCPPFPHPACLAMPGQAAAAQPTSRRWPPERGVSCLRPRLTCSASACRRPRASRCDMSSSACLSNRSCLYSAMVSRSARSSSPRRAASPPPRARSSSSCEGPQSGTATTAHQSAPV